MNAKVLVLAALVLVLAAVAAGCGGNGDTAAPAGSETATAPGGTGTGGTKAAPGDPRAAQCPGAASVGFTIPLPDPNYQLIAGMVEGDVRAAGGTFRKAVANLDPNKQIADIQSMVSAGVKTLIVAPVNPEALQPVLAKLRGQGVQLVVTDVFVGGPYATNVATSPFDAGFEGARYLQKLVGGGKVAAIEAPTFAGQVIAARNEGFAKGAKAAGLTVVDRKTISDFTPQEGRKFAEQFKVKYGRDLAGLWTFNDLMALGASSARGAGFAPKIVSINGEPPVVDLIRAGKVAATFNLHPEAIAHTLAWAAEAARCERELPKTIWVPVTRVDKSNVDEWVSWKDLPGQPFTVELEQRKGKTWVKVEG